MPRTMTMGVLVGNRGFFPSHLATSGRMEIVAALESAGIKPIVLSPEVTAHGAVETYEDAKKCAALFKQHAAEIDGLIITLPNFGEERAIARRAMGDAAALEVGFVGETQLALVESGRDDQQVGCVALALGGLDRPGGAA